MASGGEDEAVAALVSMGGGAAVGGSTRTRRARVRFGEEADEAALLEVMATDDDDEADGEEGGDEVLDQCATCEAWKFVPRNPAPGWSCSDYPDLGECNGENAEGVDEIMAEEADDSESEADSKDPWHQDFLKSLGSGNVRNPKMLSNIPVVQCGVGLLVLGNYVRKKCQAVGCGRTANFRLCQIHLREKKEHRTCAGYDQPHESWPPAFTFLSATDERHFGPAPDTVNVGSKVLAKSEEHQVGDDDDGNDIFEAVVQSMDNGQIKVKYTDDGVLETLPAENVKVHLAKFLPTTRRTLVPVPVEGPVPISGPTQPSDDETNEDEQWVEETVDQCSEFVDSTAAAEGVDPPSEESRKQIKDMLRSAVKLRAKGRTFVPMGEVLADPKIRWMWRYYDVVLKNGNLGATDYSRCMLTYETLMNDMVVVLGLSRSVVESLGFFDEKRWQKSRHSRPKFLLHFCLNAISYFQGG